MESGLPPSPPAGLSTLGSWALVSKLTLASLGGSRGGGPVNPSDQVAGKVLSSEARDLGLVQRNYNRKNSAQFCLAPACPGQPHFSAHLINFICPHPGLAPALTIRRINAPAFPSPLKNIYPTLPGLLEQSNSILNLKSL